MLSFGDMRVMKYSTAGASSEVISAILNCVCPDCGGSIGSADRAFKCQGRCKRDWREVWEQNVGRFASGRED
jgi:tRNA(Ile2) C34 agmatinyltransferase TiaS